MQKGCFTKLTQQVNLVFVQKDTFLPMTPLDVSLHLVFPADDVMNPLNAVKGANLEPENCVTVPLQALLQM